MVCQNVSDLLGSEVGKGRADVLECLVVGCEDCYIRCVVDGVDEIGCVESAAEGGEACSREGVYGSLRQDQQTVDDVDDTSSEVYVLIKLAKVRYTLNADYLQQL